MRGAKIGNYYQQSLSEGLYQVCPKAVLAAIAVSALTVGGDYLDAGGRRVLKEWWVLYHNGIVPQRPPYPEPADEVGEGSEG